MKRIVGGIFCVFLLAANCFAGNIDTLNECRPNFTRKGDTTQTASRLHINGSIIPEDAISQVEWDTCEIAANLKLARAAKKEEIKAEGLALMQAQLPGIKDFETAEMYKEFILSVKPEARDLRPKVQAVSDLWTDGTVMLGEVNALITEQEINDYVIDWQ